MILSRMPCFCSSVDKRVDTDCFSDWLCTGGLALRVSSAADILDDKGHERSAKSISPVQTEGVCSFILSQCARSDNLFPSLFAADEQAFGSRQDKLAGCVLQRKSWDLNTELLTSIFVAVREPLPKERRMRGESGATYNIQKEATIRKRDQMGKVKDEADAKLVLEEAAFSKLARATKDVARKR